MGQFRARKHNDMKIIENESRLQKQKTNQNEAVVRPNSKADKLEIILDYVISAVSSKSVRLVT